MTIYSRPTLCQTLLCAGDIDVTKTDQVPSLRELSLNLVKRQVDFRIRGHSVMVHRESLHRDARCRCSEIGQMGLSVE